MSHQARLAETIRQVARWRRAKGLEFADDERARRGCLRAATAQRVLANFAAGLPEDDLTLRCLKGSEVVPDRGHYRLCREAFEALSRFGMGKGAWVASTPTEAQMRNVLHRVDGMQQRARREARVRAERGYGDE